MHFQKISTLTFALLTTAIAHAATSDWAKPGPDGKLQYKTTDSGDHIMDFSSAGYMGGGVPLPSVPTAITLTPLGNNKDDSAQIQAALDSLAKLPLKGGFHGALQLAPGDFTCSATINLQSSGIVLRGSGEGKGGTTIHMTGPKHRAFNIGRPQGRGADRPPSDDAPDTADTPSKEEFTAAQTTLADAYVPAGSNQITLASASNFHIGDTLSIKRPTTDAWLHLMQMDTIKRDGKPQTWIGKNRSGTQQRTITAITGNKITLNIPLADSYDNKLLTPPGVTISKIKPAPTLSHIGIENLHIQCPPLESSYGQAPYSAIRVAAEDSFVRNVFCEETMNSTTLNAPRITMENVTCTHTFPNLGASKPTDFSIETTQALIDRCHITGDNEYFVWTASLDPGPNVILNSTFRGHGSRIQPHMRWSTGLLVDNCTVPDGGIDFPNRGVAGSGHGWTMGWAVAWNCIANTYIIQQPPGAMNWSIGNIGTREKTARYFDTGPILPEGATDSPDSPVTPQSLYLAQLVARLGPSALANIGYSANDLSQFPDKNTPKLPSLSENLDPQLGPDLALHRPINTSNNRKSENTDPRLFSGERAVDNNPNTYWATQEAGDKITFELDLEGPVDINALAISEYAPLTGRIQQYKVEAQVNSDWSLLSEGTTVGNREIDHFKTVTAWKVRLTLLKTTDFPAISTFSLYKTRE